MDIKLLTDVEKASIGERQPLPERYLRLSDDEMDARIAAAKQHARRPRRDPRASLSARRSHQVRRLHRRLAEALPRRREPRQGRVHRLLRRPLHGRERRHPSRAASESVLPDLAAGCSMADMAAPDQLDMCWRELGEMGVRTDAIENGRAGVIPVTYINSSAAIKAFVGDARRHRLHLDQRRRR